MTGPLLSKTATFAESCRSARERVDHGEGVLLFRRTHGVPLDLGALSRPSGPRPPNGHSMALFFLPPSTSLVIGV